MVNVLKVFICETELLSKKFKVSKLIFRYVNSGYYRGLDN